MGIKTTEFTFLWGYPKYFGWIGKCLNGESFHNAGYTRPAIWIFESEKYWEDSPLTSYCFLKQIHYTMSVDSPSPPFVISSHYHDSLYQQLRSYFYSFHKRSAWCPSLSSLKTQVSWWSWLQEILISWLNSPCSTNTVSSISLFDIHSVVNTK